MDYYKIADIHREKLDNVLDEENMVLSIRETYPLTLVISRNQAPEEQLSFLAAAEAGESAPDFSLRFIFRLEGLKVHTNSRMCITDDFLTKLKGLAKKWHAAYTHAFFAANMTQVERLDAPKLTNFDENQFAEFMDDERTGSGLTSE